MSPSSPPRCPRCKAPIPVRAADQLCPACLMAEALNEPGDERPLPDESQEFPRRFGGYRLLGFLGGGGMGKVYEAEHIASARRVALKVLGRELDTPQMRQRFLREGRLAAGIRHSQSLYVFGTEEVEGSPVITMEIASGGTLNDRLKQNGPLPVVEAVDAILDVISGLEAAFEAGVLHRDIKPSNCFVSADGSVKIGDFGLSVSTEAKDDSDLTNSGAIMGTPAFASPEQLRGMELDVRADLYSVGATLFALLTGKPPIAGRNPAAVVAAALEVKPKGLNELRQDVPAALAHVVARCLAKKPEQRYANYAGLRQALLPFSSFRPSPSPLGRRAFAGFLDVAVCGMIPAVSIHAFFGFDIDDRLLFTERSQSQLFAWVGFAIFFLVYFTVMEGIWGAGLGKALMGLQVTKVSGQAQGLPRALLRSATGAVFGNSGKAICLLTFSAQQYEGRGRYLVEVISVLIAALAIVTMRRRNGYATIWDLLTKTRVMVKPKGTTRPIIKVATPPEPIPTPTQIIGPYQIFGEVVPSRWLVGWDPALRRQVWLRRRLQDLVDARRDAARAGRPRWLQSVSANDATWDVFEAPPGTPLPQLIRDDRGLPWESVRYWLHDLGTEVAAAGKDHTLPSPLSIDHVWITAEGRAMLLEEPWPNSVEDPQCHSVTDLEGRQRFLHRVATFVDPVTVPIHARTALQSLADGSFERLSFLVGNLRSLLAKPARVDRQFRAASLLSVPLFLVIFMTLLVIGDHLAGGTMTEHEGLPPVLMVPVLILFALGSCLALPQLLTSLAAGTTLGQHAFGFSIVDATGAPARRLRLFARWLIAWTIPILVFIGCTTLAKSNPDGWVFLPLLGLLPWLLGLVVAILRPARGWHDQWSGCWLVPR